MTEYDGEKDDAAEVHGEPTAAGSVCDAAPGSPVCGELGGWLGFHRSYEVSHCAGLNSFCGCKRTSRQQNSLGSVRHANLYDVLKVTNI